MTSKEIVFEKLTDQDNYSKACDITHEVFTLAKAKGGIGVITDKDYQVISFEFILDINNKPINFGSCLTTDELLAKAKLYKQLITESINANKDLLHICMQKVQKNPRFKIILQDLALVAELLRHLVDNEIKAVKNTTIH
ncbi:hypothetical protein [Facilibium subflavum]|uniref:hypothetical protein n=1 Tax=Facilibium subflavum TaxID=2219058 RepID=UPI000E652A26|nr:hypothetical protein [Facilibium subflavum]